MKQIITTLFFSTLIQFAYAQGTPDSIYSEVMKEMRDLKVLLPANYKSDSKEKFDVVYILDGESNLELFSHLHRFAEREQYVPGVILVAVVNKDRNRDLTPTALKNIPNSGGADNFISFFRQELIPYINKNYPTSGNNILYGHSFGGLFAIYTMLTAPNVFSSYIATDPSLWYDNEYTNTLAIEKFKSFPEIDQTLFITGRDDGMKGMGITTMDSILKLSHPKNLTYKVVAYENETHGSVQLKSIFDGLKMVYDGYSQIRKNIEYHPMNGIVLKDKPYVIYTISSFPELRYTTDGAEPTTSSPKIERITSFSGPMKLTIKSFSPKGKYNKTVTGNFVLEEPPAPVTRPKKFKSGGLSYSYFEGQWDSLPNFRTLKPLMSGFAGKDFNFSQLPSKNNFALLFEGMLEIKEEGYYLLGVASDDGARLYLKNKLLIDNDGLHDSESPRSFLMPLRKGFYPVRLEYFQKGGGADLQLKYIPPGGSEPKDIPWEYLYNDNGG
jgi:predicted alpha/beta superfamily hydrolase